MFAGRQEAEQDVMVETSRAAGAAQLCWGKLNAAAAAGLPHLLLLISVCVCFFMYQGINQ